MDSDANTIGGYRYLCERLQFSWVSSVPRNDEDAVKYCEALNNMGIPAAYVEKRELNSTEYKMLPFWWDHKAKQIKEVGK